MLLDLPGVHTRVWTTIELVDTLLSPTLLPTLLPTSNSSHPHHHDNKKNPSAMAEPSVVEQDQIAAAWMDNNHNAVTVTASFSHPSHPSRH